MTTDLNPADAVREAMDASEAAMVLRTLANNAGTPRIAKALNECADVIDALTLQAEERARLLGKALPFLENHCDEGPIWEGWKSKELISLIKSIYAMQEPQQ